MRVMHWIEALAIPLGLAMRSEGEGEPGHRGEPGERGTKGKGGRGGAGGAGGHGSGEGEGGEGGPGGKGGHSGGYIAEQLEKLDKNSRMKQLESDLLPDGAADLYVEVHHDGRILQAGPGWIEALGWTSEQLVEMGWRELLHQDDRDVLEVAEETNQQVIPRYENRWRAADGTYVRLRWAASRWKDDRALAVAQVIGRDDGTEPTG